MPTLVKPIIDRNLPPIYMSRDWFDMTEEDKQYLTSLGFDVESLPNGLWFNTYMFCIPFRNSAAIGENLYNTIYAKISGLTGYSYQVRPPFELQPISRMREEVDQIIEQTIAEAVGVKDLTEAQSRGLNFSKYFENSIALLTQLGEVEEDEDYVICLHMTPDYADQFNLYPKQFYKVQLAYGYKNDEFSQTQISAYSDYGVAKCVDQKNYPIILSMQGFVDDAINLQTSQDLVGEFYSQDLGERVVKYRFTITPVNDESTITYTTGWLPHDSASDQIQASDDGYLLVTSTDIASMKKELPLNYVYACKYEVFTTNKIYKSYTRSIINQSWGQNDFPVRLVLEANPDDGEIIIKCGEIKNNYANGMYRLERATEETSYTDWEPVAEIYLYSASLKPDQIIFRDKNIIQGKKYKYSIYHFANTIDNREVRTLRAFTQPITAEFEDMFLLDENRQLNIKFNPKVSTFKTVKIENKVETIGGTYPYLSTNGHTNYKQFVISGLISALMDDHHTFIDLEEEKFGDVAKREATASQRYSQFESYYDTDLTKDNVAREREFKLEVLDWLNNGKPKLLKSPVEGNYIVILQGVSLTPMDQVGRMLHTFSATAYEIDELSEDSLIRNDITWQKQIVFYENTIEGELNSNFNSIFENNNYNDGETRVGSIKFIAPIRSKIKIITGNWDINGEWIDEKENIYYANGQDENSAIEIQIDADISYVKDIQVSGIDGNNYKIIISNYIGQFARLTDINLSYSPITVLLDQPTWNNTAPTCLIGFELLSNKDRAKIKAREYNIALPNNEEFQLQQIIKARFKVKEGYSVSKQSDLLVWDGSFIGMAGPDNDNYLKEAIIFNGFEKEEQVFEREDLDDYSCIIFGPGIQVEISYWYLQDNNTKVF